MNGVIFYGGAFVVWAAFMVRFYLINKETKRKEDAVNERLKRIEELLAI